MINSYPYFAQTDWRDSWQNVPRWEPGSTPLVQFISVMVRFLITKLNQLLEIVTLLSQTHITSNKKIAFWASKLCKLCENTGNDQQHT
jgi:hypothetical protein